MKWSSRNMPLTHSEIWKFAMRQMETPDVPTDTGLNKAVWAKRKRTLIPYPCAVVQEM